MVRGAANQIISGKIVYFVGLMIARMHGLLICGSFVAIVRNFDRFSLISFKIYVITTHLHNIFTFLSPPIIFIISIL